MQFLKNGLKKNTTSYQYGEDYVGYMRQLLACDCCLPPCYVVSAMQLVYRNIALGVRVGPVLFVQAHMEFLFLLTVKVQCSYVGTAIVCITDPMPS